MRATRWTRYTKDTESYQSTITKALVLTVIYIFSPACLITTLVTAIPWFLSVSIIGRIGLSPQAAHLSNDPNIIFFNSCIGGFHGFDWGGRYCRVLTFMIDWSAHINSFAAVQSPSPFPGQFYHILYHRSNAHSRLLRNTLLFHRQRYRRHIGKIWDCPCELTGTPGFIKEAFIQSEP